MSIDSKVILSQATDELPCRDELIHAVQQSLIWRYQAIMERNQPMMLAAFECTLPQYLRQFYFTAVITTTAVTAKEQPTWEAAIATKSNWIRALQLDERDIETEDRDFHDN